MFSPISAMIRVVLPNFKAVDQTQAELHSLKVEKLDVCIRPFLQIWSHILLILWMGMSLVAKCIINA